MKNENFFWKKKFIKNQPAWEENADLMSFFRKKWKRPETVQIFCEKIEWKGIFPGKFIFGVLIIFLAKNFAKNLSGLWPLKFDISNLLEKGWSVIFKSIFDVFWGYVRQFEVFCL